MAWVRGVTTHFCSSMFVSQLKVNPKSLDEILIVAIPGDKILKSHEYIDDCKVRMSENDLPIQMILQNMVDFDMIIGMN